MGCFIDMSSKIWVRCSNYVVLIVVKVDIGINGVEVVNVN